MLAGSFKTNQPYILLLLVLLVPALWGYGFITSTGTTHISGMPFFMWVYKAIDGFAWAPLILGILLTLLIAVLSNGLYNDLELFERRDHLSALLFAIFISIANYKTSLEPVLCALPFAILAIQKTSSVQDLRNASGVMFDIGLLLGLGTLFYSKIFLLIIPAMIMVQILRSFEWREHFALILGVITPLVILILSRWAFDLQIPFDHWTAVGVIWNGYTLLAVGSALVLFALALPSAMKYYSRSIMKVKNLRAGISGFMVLFAVLGLLELFLERPCSSTLLALPAAYYGSFFFRRPKSMIFTEVIFTLLLVIAFWVQWS